MVGAQLRTWREKADLTQEELAALIDVERKTIQRTESGKTVPNFGIVERWAKACGADVAKVVQTVTTKPRARKPERPRSAGGGR